MSWANLDLNQALIYFESMKDVIGKEKKSQESLEKIYQEKVLESPAMEQLQVLEASYDKTADVPSTGVQISEGATVIGSMTGTGEGYSWTNAPGRLMTAGEQLRIPAIVGYKVATSTTPAGMLLTLGVGLYRAGRTYA